MHQAEANEKKVKGLEYRYHLTPIFLEKKIESIIEWFKAHEQYILSNGENIPSKMYQFLHFHNAHNLIQKIKILYLDGIPLPKELDMYDEIKYIPRGLAVGNGIYIDEKYKADETLLKHEIIHAIQYNRFENIDSFIKQYIKEGSRLEQLTKKCGKLSL